MSFQSRFHILAGRGSAGDGLLPALAASVVLHSLVLWAAEPGLVSQAGPAPLSATLRAAAAPAPAAAIPAGQPARNGVGAKAVGVASAPTPAVKHSVGAEAPPANTSPTIAPPAEIPAAMPAGPGEGAHEPAPAGAAAGPDADGIRAYRIGLARAARGHRSYPALARERGWTGTAEVSVDVSREGRPRQILLARSSGHDILDREAVNMMSRAAASAILPNSLRGREFAVRLPVVFDLDDRL